MRPHIHRFLLGSGRGHPAHLPSLLSPQPFLQTAGPFMSQPSLPSSCSSPWCSEQNANPSLCPPPVGGGPVPPPTPRHSTAAPDTQVTPAGPVLRSLPAPALKEAPSCLPGCPVSFIPPFIIVPNYLWLRSPVPVCPPPRTSCEFRESRGLCVPRACRPHSPNTCKATRNSSRG